MNFSELKKDEKLFEYAVSVFAKRFKLMETYGDDAGGGWPYKINMPSFLYAMGRHEFQHLDGDAMLGVMAHCRDRGLVDTKSFHAVSSSFFRNYKLPVMDGELKE